MSVSVSATVAVSVSVSVAPSLYLFHLCAATGNKNTQQKADNTFNHTLANWFSMQGEVVRGGGEDDTEGTGSCHPIGKLACIAIHWARYI